MGQASPVTVVTPSVKAPVTPTPSWPVYRRAAPTLAPRQNAGTSAPASGSSSGSSSSSSSSSDNDDRLPAGGLTVTQPAQTADESYYKIAPHETVTFGWSFTSLKTQPDRLYVVASCSQNGYTYPIAPSPQGIPGDATSVTWYPYGYRLSAQANGQPDLAAAKYRLVIYDEEGPSAAARGGRFSPNNAVEFAMYFPQAYTPLAGTCLYLAHTQNGTVLRAMVHRPSPYARRWSSASGARYSLARSPRFGSSRSNKKCCSRDLRDASARFVC